MVNYLWGEAMKNKFTLLAGVLAGITSPSSIYAQQKYPSLIGSDMERMRGDARRVGGDFHTVIERENVKKQAAAKTK